MRFRYFFDENLLAVGKAIGKVRDDVAYPGNPEFSAISRGAKDADWLPLMGPDGFDLAIFSVDKFRHPGETEIVSRYRVKIVRMDNNTTNWEKLELIVKYWKLIEKACSQDGGFVKNLRTNGLRDAH